MIASLLILAMLQSPQRAAADPCASAKPAASLRALVVLPSNAARDTVIRATVCVVPPAGSAPVIGSYHGELHFDSTVVREVAVEKAAGGVRVENANLKGQVNFAGAAPSGLPGRALVTVVLRLRRAGTTPAVRLTMKELNS
ncbi:MAG TPA: hypothetical protein VEB19_00960, partial [Gemmatimonadaceae bacterium]|nr:hypothetical protein [Gemmatimonadaceae bacterium]